MAVSQGRKGKIQVRQCGSTTKTWKTVAEMGNWAITGQSRDMIEHTKFQDSVKTFIPGMLDPGGFTFSGFYDNTDTTGQKKLISIFSSGVAIGVKSTAVNILTNLRLWANTSTAFGPKGFWSCTGSTVAQMYITGVDVGQDKSGLGTISFTAKVSGGSLGFSTSS